MGVKPVAKLTVVMLEHEDGFQETGSLFNLLEEDERDF
tara:strand:+ start:233 stop:346 length:114 start_codon:yes stop_codon:yes gene_type:complete